MPVPAQLQLPHRWNGTKKAMLSISCMSREVDRLDKLVWLSAGGPVNNYAAGLCSLRAQPAWRQLQEISRVSFAS
jgi:hypothetical protein